MTKTASEIKELFLKDVRAYLTEANDYDIKRIGSIFEKHLPTPELPVVKVIYREPGPQKNEEPKTPPICLMSVSEIENIVCEYYKVKISSIKGRNSNRTVAYIRRVIFYFAAIYSGMKSNAIINGYNLNRTCVSHASKMIAKEVKNKNGYHYNDVCKIEKIILNKIKEKNEGTEQTISGDTRDL